MNDAAEMVLLLALVESIAALKSDGHVTLLRFTTGWKVGFGTVDLDAGTGRSQVMALPSYPTLREALQALVITQADIYG